MEDTPVKTTHSNQGTETIITSQNGKLRLSVGTGYQYYTGFVGDDSLPELSPSENYVFRPDPDIPLQRVSKNYNFIMYQGPVITETHWYFNEWFSYVHISDPPSTNGEFHHLVGPLPYNSKGIEVVIRFKTDLEYDDTIYTDTNGRERIERKRNYRPTWDVNVTEPESGNYYPVTSSISLMDSSRTAGVTVLNDRAEGGGSMDYQYIELMIHRNTINTTKGLNEALNEKAFGTGVVSMGTHYLMFTGSQYSLSKDPTPDEVAKEISLGSWMFFASPNGLSYQDYRKNHVMEYSGLGNTSLPRNVHLLTLEPWGPSSVLLRLENFIGKEDTRHSGTATVNIQDIFSTFKVESLKETTLGANQWLEENSRIKFNTDRAEKSKVVQDENDFNVTLEPMQIRTLIVTISY